MHGECRLGLCSPLREQPPLLPAAWQAGVGYYPAASPAPLRLTGTHLPFRYRPRSGRYSEAVAANLFVNPGFPIASECSTV